MSNRTFTTIEMPTPTSPVVAASESARLWRPSGAVAFTVSVSLESSVAPLPTDAMVSYFTTWTASEPATAFCDWPPDAERPQAIRSLLSPTGVIASTVMPLPVM